MGALAGELLDAPAVQLLRHRGAALGLERLQNRMAEIATKPRTWRYDLPNERGEGWAIIFIDERGLFTAVSDYGNYGYWWTHHGCDDARRFFLRAERDYDYFANKLAGGKRDLNHEQTLVNVKRHICEQRLEAGRERGTRFAQQWTAEFARQEWENAKSWLDDTFSVDVWYMNTGIDDASELTVYETPRQAVAFVKIVMKRLAKLIEAELKAEAA